MMNTLSRKACALATFACVVLALSCQGIGISYQDPTSKCFIVDQAKWVASNLGSSSVVDPYCDQIVYQYADFKQYALNIVAGVPSKVNGGRYAFYDNAGRLVGYPTLQNQYFFFSGGTASLSGWYNAASDSAHSAGTDYARVRVYLTAFPYDSARAQAALTYRFRSPAVIGGPTLGVTSQNMNFVIDAVGEYRPVTYEWFIDGASQGAASAGAYSFSKSWASAGTHTVSARVVPPAASPYPTPYTLPIAVEVAVPLTVNITGPASVRQTVYCLYSAAASSGTAPYTYNWSGMNGTPSGDSFTLNTQGYGLGTYTLSVGVIDSRGIAGTKSKTVTISTSAPVCLY